MLLTKKSPTQGNASLEDLRIDSVVRAHHTYKSVWTSAEIDQHEAVHKHKVQVS